VVTFIIHVVGEVYMLIMCMLFLCAATSVFAQMPSVQQRLFEPATMTNRQLSFFGDASAVGWNPSLLGTRPTLDVVAATSLDDQFALSGQYGVFVRMLGFAAGYVANTGNFATGELYAGLGLNIIDDVLWFGASGRMVNPGELRNVDWSATRYNASLLIKPINGLYLTGAQKRWAWTRGATKAFKVLRPSITYARRLIRLLSMRAQPIPR
jgi:hypothetical protein